VFKADHNVAYVVEQSRDSRGCGNARGRRCGACETSLCGEYDPAMRVEERIAEAERFGSRNQRQCRPHTPRLSQRKAKQR